MIHELRVYYCAPGKLPNLHKRFAEHTLKLWERHGIRQVGFWTVYLGASSNALYYMLEWQSLAEREQKWAAFFADADWQKARADSEKDGAILTHIDSTILTATPYSKLK